MAVQKFKTFEDARRALWRDAGDPEILVRMRRLAAFRQGPSVPHGVFRFRTIAEAKARHRPA